MLSNFKDAMRNTFTKAERLVGKTTFEQLLEEGESFRQFPMRVVWCISRTEQKAPVRIAFSIPKRNFRHAVKRNLIRRQMREAWRKQKHELYALLKTRKQSLDVLIIYTHNEVIVSKDMEVKILLTLQRLIRTLNEFPN
jgi:ribonuclease P protein component